MQSEDLILFGEDRDEVAQIINRKKYVELHNSQTELTDRDLGFTNDLPSASHLASTTYIFCVRIIFLPALHG